MTEIKPCPFCGNRAVNAFQKKHIVNIQINMKCFGLFNARFTTAVAVQLLAVAQEKKQSKHGTAGQRRNRNENTNVEMQTLRKKPPIYEEKSNENWVVYKTVEKCECGGTFQFVVVDDSEKSEEEQK